MKRDYQHWRTDTVQYYTKWLLKRFEEGYDTCMNGCKYCYANKRPEKAFENYKYQASSVNQLNSFASIWCVIENIFLAATAEGMAYSMRIPVGEEEKNVATALSVPTGYIIPCYIGIGYPSDTCKQIEQITYTADQKMHFGKW